MSKRNKVLSLILVFAATAHIVVAKPAPVGYNPAAMETKSAVKIMKASSAWINTQTQIDQYNKHYALATNQIAQVDDKNTREALTGSLNAISDCHDALVKLIKCFNDYAGANSYKNK